MSLNIDKFLAKSDYNIAVKDAYVIIRNQQTGSLRVRCAGDFKETLPKLKKLLQDQVPVQDPKKNAEKCFTIIFYGQKNLAKAHIAEEKEKQDDLQLNRTLEDNDEVESPTLQEPASNRFVSSVSLPRLNRTNNSTSNYAFNNTPELISLMNSIRDDQIRTQQFLKDFVKDNEVMKQKLDDIANKQNKDKKRVSYTEGAELIQFCTAEVARIRTEKNCFELRLKEIDWDSLDLAKKDKDNILAELRWERKVSRMISNIGKILFGPLLLTHILGRYGRRERSRRETERPHTFNLDQEEKLREVLRVFGDLFITDKVWKTIVQHHINQKGRDVKKSRKRTHDSDDDSSSSSSDEAHSRNEDNQNSSAKKNRTDKNPRGNYDYENSPKIVEIPFSQPVNFSSLTARTGSSGNQDLDDNNNLANAGIYSNSLDEMNHNSTEIEDLS